MLSPSSRFSQSHLPLALMLGLALVHVVVWTFGPSLFLGNVHQDTIEIVYWSRELALGYPKHPPLAPYLVHWFMVTGGAGIFSLMVLSQIGFLITAVYGAATRAIARTSTAQIFIFCALLVSPMAGIFGVQVNHNSLLMPAWAASLYYGFAYLEHKKFADALGLACAAAIGAWMKYEIAFPLLGLVAAALFWRPYWSIWRRWESYFCVLLCVALLAPHIWWLLHVDASSVSYALQMQATDHVSVLSRLNNLMVGLGVCVLGASSVLVVMRLLGARFVWQVRLTPAAFACAVSLVLLVVMSFATAQEIRQGWVIPFTPSVVLALASWLVFDDDAMRPMWRKMIYACAALTSFLCLGFAGYVIARAQGQKPIVAYSYDGAQLSQKVAAQWAAAYDVLLSCLIIDEHYMSAAPLLWLKGEARVVDFSVPYWSRPDQIAYCNEKGGVMIHPHQNAPINYVQYFPRLCASSRKTMTIGARFAQDARWSFDVALLPPQGQDCP